MIQPYYVLFGKVVSSYAILIFTGVALSALVAFLFCKRKGTERYEILYSAIYTLIGGFVGAKLLAIIVEIPNLISGKTLPIQLLTGGFVFYGGLIGGILGLFIYCKQFKVSMLELSETYATVLPLGHAFGRVGCFFSGCCYGMHYDGWLSYTYPESYNSLGDTPLGVPLLPVQLFEAAGLCIIFAVLLTVYLRTGKKLGYAVKIYAFMYSILRFVLEFFRADAARGHFLFFSTSQWISILLFGYVVVDLAVKYYKRRKQTAD